MTPPSSGVCRAAPHQATRAPGPHRRRRRAGDSVAGACRRAILERSSRGKKRHGNSRTYPDQASLGMDARGRAVLPPRRRFGRAQGPVPRGCGTGVSGPSSGSRADDCLILAAFRGSMDASQRRLDAHEMRTRSQGSRADRAAQSQARESQRGTAGFPRRSGSEAPLSPIWALNLGVNGEQRLTSRDRKRRAGPMKRARMPVNTERPGAAGARACGGGVCGEVSRDIWSGPPNRRSARSQTEPREGLNQGVGHLWTILGPTARSSKFASAFLSL